MKRCSKCGQLLELKDFQKDSAYKDGYKTFCKKCVNEYKRERLLLAKEKEDNELEESLGGYRVYVLNHTKRGEFKYNVVSTKGGVFHTNDKRDFLSFLTEI